VPFSISACMYMHNHRLITPETLMHSQQDALTSCLTHGGVQGVTGEFKASQLQPTCACSQALLGSMPFSSRLRNGCVLISAPHLYNDNYIQWRDCMFAMDRGQAVQTELRSKVLRTHAACRTATPLGTPRR
jgi:hypothetical protein